MNNFYFIATLLKAKSSTLPAGHFMGIFSTDVPEFPPRRLLTKMTTVSDSKTTITAAQANMAIIVVLRLDSKSRTIPYEL